VKYILLSPGNSLFFFFALRYFSWLGKWLKPMILITQELEITKITLKAILGKKSKTPISTSDWTRGGACHFS
jgi:hypothetical protein